MKEYPEIKVLDKGFIRLVDTMGTDASIVQAARVSYGKGTKTPSEDQALINYLVRNKHTSPLEMCELKFHCKMPIFIARQWIRHRTASVNEYSCRYSEVQDEMYVPAHQRCKKQSEQNKQGSGEFAGDTDTSKFIEWTKHLQEGSSQAIAVGEKLGIARELNRINMTVAHYTEWYWKIDLHNLLHFLKLRLDAHAQYEIRVYAEAIALIVKEHYPMAWSAFETYILNAITFNHNELKILGRMLAGPEFLQEAQPFVDALSKTERKEFEDKIEKMIAVGQ